MLFATLDPTSRKLILPSGMAVLLVDTVGFVSRLPHMTCRDRNLNATKALLLGLYAEGCLLYTSPHAGAWQRAGGRIPGRWPVSGGHRQDRGSALL